jgi:hypothetical protein
MRLFSAISGSHGDEDAEYGLLGCDAEQFCRGCYTVYRRDTSFQNFSNLLNGQKLYTQ